MKRWETLIIFIHPVLININIINNWQILLWKLKMVVQSYEYSKLLAWFEFVVFNNINNSTHTFRMFLYRYENSHNLIFVCLFSYWHVLSCSTCRDWLLTFSFAGWILARFSHQFTPLPIFAFSHHHLTQHLRPDQFLLFSQTRRWLFQRFSWWTKTTFITFNTQSNEIFVDTD